MSRSSTLILIGILILVTPFSGLPSAFRTLLLVIFGAIALGLGIAERAEIANVSRTLLEKATTPEPLGHEPPHGVSPI